MPERWVVGTVSASRAARASRSGPVAVAGGVPLLGPAAHLAGGEALGPAEVGQPDGLVVDRVQVGQDVDEPLADGAALLGLVGVPGREGVDGVDPDDPLHDVEGRAEHRLVGAHVQRAGHRDGGPAQRGDHPVLPGHVVRGGQHRARGRPAEDHRVVRGAALRASPRR